MADTTVTLRIITDTGDTVGKIEASRKVIQGLGATSRAAGASVAGGMGAAASATVEFARKTTLASDIAVRSHKRVSDGVGSISQSLAKLQSWVAAFAGIKLFGFGADELARLSDSYANISSKIRNVTASEAELASVRTHAFDIAQRTRSGYESTVELYTRLTRATASLGTSQADNLRITETINKAFIVSGASAQEANNAIIQLAQGLSAGALRGDEFNSVAEQAPILMDLLARSLGMTRGELRAYAAEGKITAEVVTTALLEGGASVDAQFGKMQLTIAGASQQLKNAMLEFVGSASQANGAGQVIAQAISLVARNLGVLVTAAEVAASVFAARMIPQLLTSVSAFVGTQVASRALATELGIVATAANASGGMLAGMGRGLLGLVGGPVGAAVLAFGALAAAIYSVYKAEQERIAKFNDGIKNLENATAATIELTRARAALAANTPKDLGEVASREADNLSLLAEKQAEYNKKRAELEAIEGTLASVRMKNASLFGALAMAERDAVINAGNTARAELDKLKTGMDALRGATDQLTVEMRDRFVAFLANDLPAAAKDAANALRDVWAAAKGGNAAGAMSGLFGSIGDVLDKAKARFLDADKAGVQAFNEIKDGAAKAADELAKFGKTQADVARIDVAARIAKLELAHALPETIAAARADGEAWIKDAAALDAAREASKHHAKEKRDEAAEFIKATQDRVASLDREIALYGMSEGAAILYDAALLGLSGARMADAQAAAAQVDALAHRLDVMKEEAEWAKKLEGSILDQLNATTAYEQSLIRMTPRQQAVARAQKEAEQAFKANAKNFKDQSVSITEYVDAAGAAAAATFDLGEGAKALADVQDELTKDDAFAQIEKQFDTLRDKIREAFDGKPIEEMQAALDSVSVKEFGAKLESAANNTAAGLRSLQSIGKEGAKYYQALQVAIDAANIAAAIGAILNQSGGDPYTAFARMAAMAAAVATLVGDIGSFTNASFTDVAKERQETQGTGTVLGDASAKSESIAHATEITANATQQLVGINRGMLRALQSLQQALGAAGNQLARGAGNADFPGMGSNGFNLDLFGGDPVTGAISTFLFGGVKKITDQGIVIAGGALRDMLNAIVVGAYQTIQTSSGLFGGGGTKENVTDISDSFGKQFQLVIKSIADTVRQGALALGLLPDDIEAAIANFRVEEIRISLKGLSAEDQQKELEAVFSSLFDGLAGAVVPFIAQFQRVGEGLGETLVRIATEVQVAQEAFKQLGLAVGEADPERFAQISDSLIQAAGGLDAFISGMQSFVANFAPESHQFAVASDALSSALSQVGLSVPATRDGMWALMQSLDATTESGRAQIATLLRLADVADAYYTALDKQTAEATKLLDSMGLLTNGLSDFGRGLVSIKAQEASAIDAANTLAKAQGRTGASSMQLAAIHTWTAKQIAAAIRQLQVETRDLVAKLYGGVPGSLDAINDRIAEIEQGAGSLGSTWSDSVDSVADASAQLFESWRNGVKSVQDYLDSMLLGDLSGLTPEEQLAEAQRQLIAMQEAAMGGDADALNQLPQLADAYLRLLRGSVASGGDYNAGFDWVRQLLQSVVDMPNPGTEGHGNTGGGGGGTTTVVASPELQALYAARDAALAAQEAEYRRQLAQDLTQHLSDLATALNVPIFELIEAQGVNLAQLATDLGADLANLNAASIEALGGMATTLGVPLAELVQQLGLSMPDLKEGLVELTQSLGIDLSALTGTTAGQLAALAGSLGGNLRDLSTALGIDLGKLIDVNSPIFVALKDNIGDLSPDIRDELDPLLKAVADASGDEAKNAAVKALRDHVDELAPDIKNQLAPYFDDIMPQSALTQLDYLDDINRIAGEQLTALGQINNNLAAANREAGIPSYAVGTGNVPSDGLAMIHQGEAIIPAPFAAWMRSNGIPVARGGAANDDSALLREVRELRAEVTALRRDNNAGHAGTQSATRDEGAKASRQRDDLARKANDATNRRQANG